MEVEGPIVAESPSLGRKRLSDITNMNSRGSEPDKGCHERPITAKDYIGHLLKENNALLRMVEERNKIVEVSGMELQNLKFSLQKVTQQNWQLAQANSQMLAEINSGKDRLKALQHELRCTVAVLKTKTLELEEVKKLKKQREVLRERISHETLKEGHTEPAEVAGDPSHPANCKKPCNNNRKRTLRSQSLGPTTHQGTTKEKEEGTKPAELSEDPPHPANNCKKACNTKMNKRTLRSRSLGPAIVVAHQETTKEKEEGRMSLRRRSSNLRAELHEPSEDLFEIEDVKLPAPSRPIAVSNLVKDETERDIIVSPRSQGQELRRPSLGRPLRRAAEKVCYKEVPLNVKMRRSD
ncbi:SHUGOSHIN 2-like isoform X1 [Iris pallida]|uniref:SHUGOSHIN 2-like isoform X1 n=1 Tax=Iris pallida TaxID=29817 RepID=A0AAX6F1P6_IRIPA|nr:SHUGOSHIN 2-like isoform X1 [Iris pallida]KAJ6851987.1 SHUGOSHIN 2-like isoform X1 [Iris pallida]